MFINVQSNHFSVTPVLLAGWQDISIEQFNELRATGWEPSEYVAPYRVSKDTIISRVLAAGALQAVIAVLSAQSDEQKFLWENSAWFWNNNPTLNAICAQLNLDADEILSQDPYM